MMMTFDLLNVFGVWMTDCTKLVMSISFLDDLGVKKDTFLELRFQKNYQSPFSTFPAQNKQVELGITMTTTTTTTTKITTITTTMVQQEMYSTTTITTVIR
jgi:hypothetical protein